MRRFLTLVCLLCVAIPAGISISGCTRNPAGNYCNGLGYGLTDTNVASIFLTPQTTGISLAFGQTQQIASPTAKTCKGTSASVSSYTYGTTNNQLVDISPSGNICAGTWNRNTGGGIPNYTICNFPSPLPGTAAGTGTLPYGTAYLTASADSVTSNPVEVFVHPQVTSVTLAGPASCLSQGTLYSAPLDVQACYVNSSTNLQALLCAPPSITQTNDTTAEACSPPAGVALSSIPDCTSTIGTLSYSVGNSSVASINTDTNQITAGLPGTTAITASVAGGASSAGYFSTCPPKSISVTLANGATTGTITQGVAQNLTTTVYDTNNNIITGLTLDYQSTDPIDISVGTTGGVTTNFPGVASITAICQPSTCNPAPINEIGLYGTGLSISSNPVTITTPGTASDYFWVSSPGRSQYFVPVELLTGTVGSTVRLPYVPNSMLMDRNGISMYFGSARELMSYSTATNSLSKQDTTAPGVVLAVAPSNTQLLINDQARHLFYLYGTSGSAATFGGMGASAQWTPDGKTLYVFDNSELNTPASCPTQPITGHTDTLYVYNVNSGWTTYQLSPSPLPAAAIPSCTAQPNTTPPLPIQTPALTIPGVGAFLPGSTTVAHTWCPVGGFVNNQSSISAFYPLPANDTVPALTDVLTATNDGLHILGAAVPGNGPGPISLSDIGVAVPTSPCAVSSSGTMSALTIPYTFTAPITVGGVTATTVNQVVSSPQTKVAFITYSGDTAGATLPWYVPGTSAVNYLTLNNGSAVTAPLVGAFTPDDSLFFVGTAGDNLVHYITIPSKVTTATPPTDTQQIAPGLPACIPVSDGGTDPGCIYTGTGDIVPVTAIVVKPRSTT